MTPSEAQLLEILQIGHEVSIAGAGVSLERELRRTHYRALRLAFGPSDLVPLIRAKRCLVEQWLAYSEAQRAHGGWGLLLDGEAGQVRRAGKRLQFGSIDEAVAEYVVRELDFRARVPAAPRPRSAPLRVLAMLALALPPTLLLSLGTRGLATSEWVGFAGLVLGVLAGLALGAKLEPHVAHVPSFSAAALAYLAVATAAGQQCGACLPGAGCAQCIVWGQVVAGSLGVACLLAWVLLTARYLDIRLRQRDSYSHERFLPAVAPRSRPSG